MGDMCADDTCRVVGIVGGMAKFPLDECRKHSHQANISLLCYATNLKPDSQILGEHRIKMNYWLHLNEVAGQRGAVLQRDDVDWDSCEKWAKEKWGCKPVQLLFEVHPYVDRAGQFVKCGNKTAPLRIDPEAKHEWKVKEAADGLLFLTNGFRKQWPSEYIPEISQPGQATNKIQKHDNKIEQKKH